MDPYGQPYVSLTAFRIKVDTEHQAHTAHPIMIPATTKVLLTRKAQATITTDREGATAINSSQVFVTVVASANAVLPLCAAVA